MGLARVNIENVRNLRNVELRGLRRINVFYGDNGSGKTSVLESVFLLGMARSFRGARIASVITQQEEGLTVFGDLVSSAGRSVALGVSRDRQGDVQIRLAGENVKSVAALAEQLPLQIINSQSFELLIGGPGDRRQFLDWGVFHVEHRFNGYWQRFQRCIKQRNSLLRRGKISASDLAPWNKEFSEAGELVDSCRRRYFEELYPVFRSLMARLSPDLAAIELRYRSGWDKDKSLQEALESSETSDHEQGFTHVGPQRADIKVIFNGLPAGDTLSRGQQKLTVCALKLAQGRLLTSRNNHACIYLVDDLPAELDSFHAGSVAEVLEELQTQVFITCVERDDMLKVWPEAGRGDLAMFHVEHGMVIHQAMDKT
jgi:DNA replication and repair protein RecF